MIVLFFICRKLRLSFARFWENRLNSPSLNRMNVIPAAGSERPPLPEKNASLEESIFRDSLKCSTVIPRSQPISVTGASSITRQTAITWPHSTSSGPNGHLKGSCKRYPDEARYISKILEQKAYPEQAYKSCSGFRALPGESVRNGLRKPAVGQYNSRDRRDT